MSVCRAMWRKVPCEHAEALCLGHSPPRSDGSMPILFGYSSSGGVSASAYLELGSAWKWAGANQVLHARAGEVSAKMQVRQHSICADFFSPIAVMHPYECISGNKSRACSLAWIAKRPSFNLRIIVIIAIIVLIVLSVSRLIAIIGNYSQ